MSKVPSSTFHFSQQVYEHNILVSYFASLHIKVNCYLIQILGRLNSSNFASELIYSLPNLIILFNDHILRLHCNPRLNIALLQSKLKIWLTIIDYTEALLELTAKRLWGKVGRWLVIGLIQLLK